MPSLARPQVEQTLEPPSVAARRFRETVQRTLGSERARARRALAFLWRRLMWRTTVIAVTGSVGKTTAKECIAAVLEAKGPVLRTFQNENDTRGVPRTLLRMRPWHRFAVVEVATGRPGDIAPSARLVRPDVAVVLRVARTHTSRFETLEDTAAEKAVLPESVRAGGLVLLNADDPRVWAMASRCRTTTRFFGESEGCDLRATDVEATWPDRLRFTATSTGGSVPVETRLVGTHWVGSVLAALAVGEACGVPLAEAASRIGTVDPFMGRMQPVRLPNGACLIRDEESGTPDTLQAMLDVLRSARARRRGLVFSDQSDTRERSRTRQREVGKLAAKLCDFAVFVGDHARPARNAALAAGMDPSVCPDAADLREAAAWVQRSLGPGDLVFLKGRTTDHLSRILFAQFGSIGCWRSRCRILRVCDVCSELQPSFALEDALAWPGDGGA